jgi:cell fate regulator YaaT (PSP1 superfamily)
MGCLGCTTCNTGSGAKGCNSNGGCGTGGCNRLNTFDWLSKMDIEDVDPLDIVEVSFKNGSRKGFFRIPENVRTITGDMVVVETGNGYDVGKVTLSGELVRLQMKKKRTDERSAQLQVIRRANDRDLERLQEAIEQEQPTMVRARAISRTLGLDMKIGDVEFQGDKRKATFYYTADGRVDFRELIRHFAKEFRVKVEMRQIGARQESARIGGIGSCGRELCCSTWLSDFKSVSTSAARYQNLAINQAKLSGQCGRLKCCLNYELDTYLDAMEDFPAQGEKLQTEKGNASLIKTDIFKKVLYYAYDQDRGRGKIYPLTLAQVKELQAKNARGEKPADFDVMATNDSLIPQEVLIDYADVTGEIELPEDKKRRKKKKKGRSGRDGRDPSDGQGNNASTNQQDPNRQERRNPQQQGNNSARPNPQQGQGQQRPPRTDRPDARPERRDQPNNNSGEPRTERPPRQNQPERPNNQQPDRQNRPDRPKQDNNRPRNNNEGQPPRNDQRRPENEGTGNPEQNGLDQQGNPNPNRKKKNNRNKRRNKNPNQNPNSNPNRDNQPPKE